MNRRGWALLVVLLVVLLGGLGVRGTVGAAGARSGLETIEAGAARQLRELMAAAKPVGEVLAIENDWVRVHYTVLQYPPADAHAADSRPVVLYLRVTSEEGAVATRLLDAPQGVPTPWRPGVVPRGVSIAILAVPKASSSLAEPSDPPSDAIVEERGRQDRLVLATFRPQHDGLGTGRVASVTVFLSDGVVDVKNKGVRRRMGVQAGDAFWFDAATQLTVVSDYPVQAAIVQLRAR